MTSSPQAGRIVRATADHLDAIVRIEAECFPAHERWSTAAWQDELDGADRLVLVALGGAAPGGDGHGQDEVMAAATFQAVEDSSDLHRIMTAGVHRGRGAARALLGHGLVWALERGAERMLLEVREGNRAAISLYENTGFTALAKRRDYYGPGADAIVMCALLGELGTGPEQETNHE